MAGKPPDAWDVRTRLLLGDANADALAARRVAIVGPHPAGSFVLEFLVRAGVRTLRVVNPPASTPLALHSFPGGDDDIAQRMEDINPEAAVEVVRCEDVPGQVQELLKDVDAVVDGTTDEAAKVAVLQAAQKRGLPAVTLVGGCGVDDSKQIKVCAIQRVKANHLKGLQKRLYGAGVRRGVECVHATVPDSGQGFVHVMCVMGAYVSQVVIDKFIDHGEKLKKCGHGHPKLSKDPTPDGQ